MSGKPVSLTQAPEVYAEAWPDEQIVQQAVGQLPWGHNLVLLSRLKQQEQRLAYAQAAIEHGWSRNVLNIHIETRLLERTGKAVTDKQTEDSVIRKFRITAAAGKVTTEIARAQAESDFDRLIKQMMVIGDEKVGGKT